MKKAIFFVYFICLVVSGLSAQNWDINTLHRVNSWDGKFVRNYNKIISRSEPYVAVGVPVAMAVAAWIKHDKGLLKDAVYVGTSVAGAFVVTYGMKYLVDRERPYDKYPDRVHAYSHEGSPSFPASILLRISDNSVCPLSTKTFSHCLMFIRLLISNSENGVWGVKI